MTALEIPLRGAGGEPVQLWRIFQSHGLVELPPMFVDPVQRTLEVTLRLVPDRPRTVVLSEGRKGRTVVIEVTGRAPGPRTADRIEGAVAHLLRLDADLSEFYAVAAQDPELSWVTAGAGRMMRSATVFEEVVKTICTTNCSWGATTKMINALVEHLGTPAPGAPASGTRGRAFPEPEAMATASDDFYRDVMRAGYRGPYFSAIARGVLSGEIDLEELARPASEIPDEEVEARLLALPGVGPYAMAHIMMMLGRYSRLILDSWTRPKYARLSGKKKVADAAIVRRWKPYGPYAGLAFWLYLTRDWVEDPTL